MPAALSTFLLSDDRDKEMDQIQASYKLNDDQKKEISEKFTDAAFNDFNLSETLNRIKAALVPGVVPEGNWPTLVADLLKIQAWPLRELFGDELTTVLNENKINPSAWPQFRVILKPLTYSGAASEVASAAGFSLMGGQSRERLRDLIMSKIKGVRTDTQIREMLIRSSDFGGLGLNPIMADKAMEALGQIIKNTVILSEDEYASWLSEEARKKTESLAPPAPKSEDELEIEKIKANMPAPAAPQTILDKAIEDVFVKIAYQPADDYLAKRLRYIISSRLRDVRTQFDLKQLLQRATKVGGLGLSKDQTDVMAAQVEEGYKIFHGDIVSEEKQKLNIQLEEQKTKIEERRKREVAEHAEWYKEKVQAKQEGEDRQKQIAERMKESFKAEHPIDAKEKRVETKKFGEMVSAARISKTPSAFSAGPAPVSSARPEIKISKTTADMQAQVPVMAKPRLDDVKYAPQKLSGPLQELKSMTLSEFRRLAKDPQVAAGKIIERIELLGQESFETRLLAIKAWQACPLQSAYMALVAESFKTGKQVALLAEDKRKAGADAPSPAELSAIISLNSKLHF